MPVGLTQPLPSDLEGQDAAAAGLPVSQDARRGEAFGHFDFSQALGHGALLGVAAEHPETGTLADIGARAELTSDAANARYGVDGYLRFNGPVSEYDAGFRQSMALERRFRDQVFARSTPSPLLDFGAGLAGALVDPGNIAVAGVTGGLGEGLLGAVGLGEAADGALAVSRLGRLGYVARGLPRALAVGALDNAPLVGAGALSAASAGDDYSFGDALRDIAAGAVLHSGLHLALRGAGALGPAPVNPDGLSPGQALAEAVSRDRPSGEAPSPLAAPFDAPRGREALMGSASTGALIRAYVPPEVDALAPAARFGAWAKAVDDVMGDRPVDVGQYIERELNPPALARLDERSALTDIPSFRPVPAFAGMTEDATAVTTRGTEIPVRFGLAEISDLVTSHTDDLAVNPAYPSELQPRERGRAGAQARNLQLEAELNPKLLISDVGAGQGAPIVSPDGVVESGNGRTIALRRAAAKGSAGYASYLAELKARGFDPEGMRQPILVRVRREPLTGTARAGLAREMNADVTERMSAAEQAMADARQLPDQAFDLIEDGRGPTTSRAFARAFIDKVAADQVGSLVDKDGRLSPEGARRIKAAVLAKAYGDPRLVGQVFEDEASPVRKLGDALAEAAPAWAQMRGLVARGEAAAAVDLTPALRSAMDLARYAAAEGKPLGELIGERLGQSELFGGESISPFTEAFLRLFYQDERFAKPLAPDKIAGALKDYARQASEVKPGPDLFGETASETTSRAILANVAKKFRDGEVPDTETLRPTGPSRPGSQPLEPPLVDLRPPGGDGDGRAGGVSPAGGSGAEGEGQPAARPKPPTGEQLIAADPELKRLADDTERLAAENGAATPIPDNQQPDTLAEAVRAAAVCLGEEGL